MFPLKAVIVCIGRFCYKTGKSGTVIHLDPIVCLVFGINLSILSLFQLGQPSIELEVVVRVVQIISIDKAKKYVLGLGSDKNSDV